MIIASLVLSGIPAVDIPVQCGLFDGIMGGLSNIIGNLLGLQSFGVVFVPVLLAILIVVAVFNRARTSVLRLTLILIAIVILASLAKTLLPQFLESVCG